MQRQWHPYQRRGAHVQVPRHARIKAEGRPPPLEASPDLQQGNVVLCQSLVRRASQVNLVVMLWFFPVRKTVFNSGGPLDQTPFIKVLGCDGLTVLDEE